MTDERRVIVEAVEAMNSAAGFLASLEHNRMAHQLYHRADALSNWYFGPPGLPPAPAHVAGEAAERGKAES